MGQEFEKERQFPASGSVWDSLGKLGWVLKNSAPSPVFGWEAPRLIIRMCNLPKIMGK
jgi:hypothetical protein